MIGQEKKASSVGELNLFVFFWSFYFTLCMEKSQFGEQIWQFFGEIFPEYIQKYGKLYT